MAEQVISAFMEKGLLGVIAATALIALWYRDKQLIALHCRYAKTLAENSTQSQRLADEVTGAVRDLNEACEKCPYRRFMDSMGNGG